MAPGTKLALFPNPAPGDQVTAEIFVTEDATVTVSAWNAALQAMKIANATTTATGPGYVGVLINVKEWGSGVYLFRVTSTGKSGKKTTHGPASLAIVRQKS